MHPPTSTLAQVDVLLRRGVPFQLVKDEERESPELLQRQQWQSGGTVLNVESEEEEEEVSSFSPLHQTS